MKLIHCADLHIDSPMAALPKEVAAKRREELLLGFKKMVDYASANNIKNILISGDLFDRKRPSASAVNSVTSVIEANPDICFFYLKGNHDCDELYEDKALIPDNLKLFDDNWTHYIIGEGDAGEGCSVNVYGIEPGVDNKDRINSAPVLDMNDFNIVMMHGDVSDSSDISLRNLRGCGIDYLALGHIHSYRYEELDKRGYFCYPGCLESRGFDECGEHGFVVIDINRYDHTQNVQLRNVSVRNVAKLEVDISDCINSVDILEAAKRTADRGNHSADDMLLIELVGSTDISCDKNLHMIEQYFDNNYYLARVHDKSEYRVDYKDYALDESLKGEFVRMVSQDNSICDEDKAAIIRLGIRALKGEELDI